VPTEPLSDIAIQRELGTLPGWARRGNTLTKTFGFRSFAEAVDFVTRVADAATAAEHYPDIDVRQTRVVVALTTETAGARITPADVALARKVEQAAAVRG
jgi:4a-hydroxytetrahydrobiopterin dehydratase